MKWKNNPHLLAKLNLAVMTSKTLQEVADKMEMKSTQVRGVLNRMFPQYLDQLRTNRQPQWLSSGQFKSVAATSNTVSDVASKIGISYDYARIYLMKHEPAAYERMNSAGI